MEIDVGLDSDHDNIIPTVLGYELTESLFDHNESGKKRSNVFSVASSINNILITVVTIRSNIQYQGG